MNKNNEIGNYNENEDYLREELIKELNTIFPQKSKPGEESSGLPIYLPGVFRILCKATNCAYFGESKTVLIEMGQILDKIELGVFENQQLIKDYHLFGINNFDFSTVVSGEEYYDDQKRKDALDLAKKSWSGFFY